MIYNHNPHNDKRYNPFRRALCPDALTSRQYLKTAARSPRCRFSVDAAWSTRQPHHMTLTNSFIAELVRDANRLENLDDYQKRRMLERAVTTIRDMRETIGIPSGPGRCSVVDIDTVALSIEHGWRSDEDVRNALLQAAGMIRDLHIVLDTKTDISFAEPAC